MTARSLVQARLSRRRSSRDLRARGRSAHGAPRRRRILSAAAYQEQARLRLRRFRGGSLVAVALTGLLLLLTGDPDLAGQEVTPAPPPDATAAVSEAAATMRELLASVAAWLPRLALVVVLLLCAWAARQGWQWATRRLLGPWLQRSAAQALGNLVIYLLTTVAVVSVLAGDVRAMIGSVGLLGLAASWALQTPIESFSGWLLNAFRGYYRVGDRIAVGEVFGDVFRIDMLTTTVWEAGGPDKSVRAAQATGALITFPNWEVLRSNVVNYTRDFPYVWDEVTFGVANESDLAYAAEVIESEARTLLGPEMVQAVDRYQDILRQEQLTFDVEPVPRVYLSLADAWTNCTLRYLVPVRTRRDWASRLVLQISTALSSPVHAGRIVGAYPRTETRLRRDWSTSITAREDT